MFQNILQNYLLLRKLYVNIEEIKMESKKIAKQILIATAVLTSFLGSNLVYADVVQSNSNNRASTETVRV
ncbi:TPA: hypothetical protein VYQ82_001968, partial [Streptococcus pneumoniae]|nr:hypothetical protein [Streptococcus pneumoniae]